MKVHAIQGELRAQLEELEKHCGTMAGGGSSPELRAALAPFSTIGGSGDVLRAVIQRVLAVELEMVVTSGGGGMVPPSVYDYASRAAGNGGSCWPNGEPYKAGGGSRGTTGFGGRVLRRDETGRLYDSCEKCGQMMYADRGGPVRCGQEECPHRS